MGRADNAAFYLDAFAGLDRERVTLPLPGTSDQRVIWNQFTMQVHGEQDALNEHLLEHGVGCEVYGPVPLHWQECFAELPKRSLPVDEKLAKEVLSIPGLCRTRR